MLELFLEWLLCWERKANRYEMNEPQSVIEINSVVCVFSLVV